MLTTTAAAALVGAAGTPMAINTKHVRVQRAFWHGGTAHAVGTVLEVPGPLAAELVAAHKAVVVEKPAPAPAPDPEKVEPKPAPAVRPARRAKE